MSATMQQLRAAGVALGLAIALAGCATTGGTASQFVAAQPGSGYGVCSGGHASRFPRREEVGRVCRPSVSASGIFGAALVK